METIYLFFIRNDVWIYIVCGLGFFWFFYQLLQAQASKRRATFGVELEVSQQRQNSATIWLIFFTLFATAVFYINSQIAPTLPETLLKPPTPTPNFFITPLAPPTPLSILPQERATVTPPFIPTATLGGGQPAATRSAVQATTTTTEEENSTATPVSNESVNNPPSSGCSLNVNIRAPRAGSQVTGPLNITGSAKDPQFTFYKLEINGPETDGQWASLLGRTVDQPVDNGFLGSSDVTGWQSGSYTIRLTVVDSTSNETGQCSITLQIN